MKKPEIKKSGKALWVIAPLVFVIVVLLSSFIHYRLDLTAEKKYTYNKATQNLLKHLNDEVVIDVYLTGNLTSGLKKVRASVDETLNEFRSLSNGNIVIKYIDVFKLDEDEQQVFIDSLNRFGLKPLTQVAQEKKGSAQSQRLVITGAMVHSVNGTYPVNFLTGVNSSSEQEYYNNIESLLEYKFASAIEKVTRKHVPQIAYLTGNGQPLVNGAWELLTTISSENTLDTFNLQQNFYIPKEYDAVIVLQPSLDFSEQDKLKIDQYLLHGGSVLFAADILDAPLDSLKLKGSALAFDKGLNLTDLLFKYGVRINPNLVLDYQCTDIPQVVGDMGGQPQIQLLKWPYYPLVQGTNHPISKNLDPVFLKYASSIDTVKTTGASKHVLLTTSANGKIIASPTIISFNAMQYAEDPNAFNQPYIPLSVLVEGNFQSLFANRLSADTIETMQKNGYGFVKTSVKPGKLIAVADGDIFLNEPSQKGMVPMGMNQFIEYTFANRTFLQNAIDYLTGNSGIFESRSKNFTLHLLDAAKIESDKQRWQIINIGLPIAMVSLFGLIFIYLKKRKYTH